MALRSADVFKDHIAYPESHCLQARFHLVEHRDWSRQALRNVLSHRKECDIVVPDVVKVRFPQVFKSETTIRATVRAVLQVDGTSRETRPSVNQHFWKNPEHFRTVGRVLESYFLVPYGMLHHSSMIAALATRQCVPGAS